jgi:hypothetical protein
VSDAAPYSFHVGSVLLLCMRGEATHSCWQRQFTSPTLLLFCSLVTRVRPCISLSCASPEALSIRCLLFTDWFVLAVVTDPEDPRFDLEKLIAKWESS